MPASQSFTLAKAERICSKKLTDRLFNGSSGRSLSAFPLRMVYTVVSREEDAPAALMLVSVPKRHFERLSERLSAATVEESIAPAKQTIEVPDEPKEDKA